MKCPYCSNEDSKVIDSRESGEETRRRRECLKCQKRFTTYERVEAADIIIIKKDNRREVFDAHKLKHSLLIACGKRPIPQEKIDRIVDEVESDLRNNKSTEIPSNEIGELVIERLKKLDKIAYIRFASVYREFTDVRSLEKELKNLKKG